MPQQLDCHRNRLGERDRALPGVILAQQTFGKGLKSHPHWHLLVTDGCFFPDGKFWPLGYWDVDSLHDAIRTAVLKSLVARRCLKPGECDRAWLLAPGPVGLLGLCGS
ncbi:transposase [bacterium]|nr:transposase [bacterium]